MSAIKRAGVHFSIRERERVCASPKQGLRQSWTEFQVLLGNKIVSRHGTHDQAVRECDRLMIERAS